MICVESEFHGGLVPTSPDEALTLWPLPPPQAPPSQQLPGETCSQRAPSTAHTASTEHVTYMNMHKKHTEALYTLLPHTQPHNHTGEPGARGAGICVVLGEHRGRVEASIKFQTQMQYKLNFTPLLLRFQLEGSYLLLWCYVGFFGNFSRSRVALAEWYMAILLWTVPTTLSLSLLHRQLVLIIIINKITLSAVLLIKTCHDWNHHHNHLHCQQQSTSRLRLAILLGPVPSTPHSRGSPPN